MLLLASPQVTLELLRFATGDTKLVSQLNLDLVAGAGTTVFFCADGKGPDSNYPRIDSASTSPGCTPFSAILSAKGCESSGRDCMLNVTVQSATFPPQPLPPFPHPQPPPPPPPPCNEIKNESECKHAKCNWSPISLMFCLQMQ